MGHVVQYTESGEAHGLINLLNNSVEFTDFKAMKPEYAEQCRKERKNDAKLVKVRYLNSRGRHERLTKPYCKWQGDPIQQWHLIPNRVYEVPYGFVKEVNGVKNMVRSGLLSVDGEPIRKDETPLDKDFQADALHQLVPVDFVFSAEQAM